MAFALGNYDFKLMKNLKSRIESKQQFLGSLKIELIVK